jgi:hypothetical protein
VSLSRPITNAFAPWVEYECAIASIDPAPALERPHAGSDVVVSLRVTRRQRAPNLEVRGDLLRLSPADARFVEYWGAVAFRAEEQRLPLRELTSQEITRERAAGVIEVDKRALRVIEGFSATMSPNIEGAPVVSLYKSDTGEYFLRQAGGCVFHWDLLFGPFRESGTGFASAAASSTK